MSNSLVCSCDYFVSRYYLTWSFQYCQTNAPGDCGGGFPQPPWHIMEDMAAKNGRCLPSSIDSAGSFSCYVNGLLGTTTRVNVSVSTTHIQSSIGSKSNKLFLPLHHLFKENRHRNKHTKICCRMTKRSQDQFMEPMSCFANAR